MNMDNIGPAIVGIAAVIILMVTVAIPIIGDVEINANDAYANGSAGQTYTYLQDPADVVIEYTENGYKVNGKTVTFEGTHTYSIITDSFVLDLGTTAEKFDLYQSGTHTAGGFGSKLDLSKDGSWTYTNQSGTEKSGSYTAAFFPSQTGKYAFYYLTGNAATHPFADNDAAVLYGGNVSSVGHGAAFVDSEGKVTEFCPMFSSSGAVNITGINVSVSDVPEVTSYKQYGQMTITTDAAEHSVNSVFAPRVYHDVYPDETLKSLVGIIPLLLIVTILIGIVGYVTLNKN